MEGITSVTLSLVLFPRYGIEGIPSVTLSLVLTPRYGIEGITSVPGWSERMLDRRYAVDREAQSLRYSLIMAINRSPVLQVRGNVRRLVV